PPGASRTGTSPWPARSSRSPSGGRRLAGRWKAPPTSGSRGKAPARSASKGGDRALACAAGWEAGRRCPPLPPGAAGGLLTGMSTLPFRSADLAELLTEARGRTLALFEALTDEQLTVPYLDIVTPPLWEFGHVAWFQERWALRHLRGQPPV